MPLETDATMEHPQVEFVTRMRGREVKCWMDGGRIDGDPELLERIRRVSPCLENLEVVEVVQLVRDAVGSAVALRFADTSTRDVSSAAPPLGSTPGGAAD